MNLKSGKRIKEDIREELEVSYTAVNRERKRLAEKMKSDPKIKEYKEYLERQAIEDLISLSGRIQIDLDWEKEEQVELDEYRDHR